MHMEAVDEKEIDSVNTVSGGCSFRDFILPFAVVGDSAMFPLIWVSSSY